MGFYVSRRGVLSALIAGATLEHKAAFGSSPSQQETNALQRGVTVSNADELAKATVRIVHENGVGLGSGFHFIQPNIIVSNAHVVEPLIAGSGALYAEAETGERWTLSMTANSPPSEFDYAIMNADGPKLDQRRVLKPDDAEINSRGTKLLYAGYPHGIDPLLVGSSEVTSPLKDKFFCIDAMIHGGNSGGPVVDNESLSVVGIVTARRFLGDPQMQQIDTEMAQLQTYLEQIRQRGSVVLMGVDFGQFALAMSRIASFTNVVIRQNSTTGIGLAHSIKPVADRCKELKLL
jgi:hypothetical protein